MSISTIQYPLKEVAAERVRQEEKWGEQNHPDANLTRYYDLAPASHFKFKTDERAQDGTISWIDIFLEEVAEAVDEALKRDKVALRAELIQCAAVATAWVEKIDREISSGV
jgi:hypothetical protein